MKKTRPTLRTNRGLAKMFFLGILTLGIYPLVVYSHMGEEINLIDKDGKHTMHYCIVFFLLQGITFGIASIVWKHRICNRIGNVLCARNINYEFSATTFWGWNVFGSFLFGVGPFIFVYKFMHAMNLLNADYNAKG